MPTLLCHRLVVEDDRIVDYRLRMPDQKRRAVEAPAVARTTAWSPPATRTTTRRCSLAADAGFWFHAPPGIAAEFPTFAACDEYPELLDRLTRALAD